MSRDLGCHGKSSSQIPPTGFTTSSPPGPAPATITGIGVVPLTEWHRLPRRSWVPVPANESSRPVAPVPVSLELSPHVPNLRFSIPHRTNPWTSADRKRCLPLVSSIPCLSQRDVRPGPYPLAEGPRRSGPDTSLRALSPNACATRTPLTKPRLEQCRNPFWRPAPM